MKTKQRKTITIDNNTWVELSKIKLQGNLKTFDEIIRFLLISYIEKDCKGV